MAFYNKIEDYSEIQCYVPRAESSISLRKTALIKLSVIKSVSKNEAFVCINCFVINNNSN